MNIIANSPRLDASRSAALFLTLAVVLVGCNEPPTAPPLVTVEGGASADVSLAAPADCQTGVQASGALYEICFPAKWNGDVVFWAHGYANPLEPLAVPNDDVDGIPVSEIVNGLGYAYAATSYRKNGLVALAAVDDLIELREIFATVAGREPRSALLVGASEGGLSTVLAAERSGAGFDGGLALCGPLGSFRGQLGYFGDFRVVFDYFFPGILPGSATGTPPAVVTQANWDNTYEPAIREAVSANPNATRQLLRVTRASIDGGDPTSIVNTVVGVLWYSFFATNDARATLGGNPFDNRFRFYRGSDNDWKLNRGVQRARASANARAAMRPYETTGRMLKPLVTLHTTGDPIVPYWHEPLYNLKTWRARTRLNLISLPAFRYGHCQVTIPEALAAFALLVLRTTGADLLVSAELLPTLPQQETFLELARREGANPQILE